LALFQFDSFAVGVKFPDRAVDDRSNSLLPDPEDFTDGFERHRLRLPCDAGT